MKTVLVTGANRGIGLALVRGFHQRGDRLIAVCRRSSPQLEQLGVRIEPGVELTDRRSLELLAERLADQRIDILVHNAGILRETQFEYLEDQLDAFREQFEVNTLAPLRLTRALLPSLADPAKLIVITSRMGSVTDNSSGGYCGYRISKAAVNMAGVCLAHELKDRRVAVALLHPGYVRTDMTGGGGDVGPDEAAAGLMARIDELTLEDSGCFVHANGQRLPW